MALEIFPSENDISGTTGGGRIPREVKLTQWNQGASSPYLQFRVDDPANGNFAAVAPGSVLSGFELLAATGLSQPIANGVAWIDGYRVEHDGDTVTLAANSFNYIYLQLTKVSSLVTSADFVVVSTSNFNDLGAYPPDSIMLYVVQTGLTDVLAGGTRTYFTASTGVVAGRYFGDGNPQRQIDLGFRPKLVYVEKQTTPRILAWSSVNFPISTDILWGLAHLELVNGGEMITRVVDPTSEPGLMPTLLDTGFNTNGTAVTFEQQTIILSDQATYNPPSLTTGQSDFNNFSFPGALVGDIVSCHFEYAPDQAAFWCRGWVTAADTVRIETTLIGGNVDAPSATMRMSLTREIPAISFSVNDSGDQYHYIAWS